VAPSIIHANFMMQSQNMLKQEVPLITFTNKDKIHNATVVAFDLWQDPVKCYPVLQFDDYKEGHYFDIHALCDRLIVLKLSNNYFYICNPTMLQWLKLEKVKCFDFAGLYPHPSSNDYHKLFHYKDSNWLSEYFVLKLGSSEKLRCIG
jgi:hypothetical protein